MDWLHLHDLRHAFAPFLLDQGEELRTVVKLLGRATIRMTADTCRPEESAGGAQRTRTPNPCYAKTKTPVGRRRLKRLSCSSLGSRRCMTGSVCRLGCTGWAWHDHDVLDPEPADGGPALESARTARNELLTLLVLLLASAVLLALCFGCATFWLYN
ncbi:hypothetical protein [Micromonospora sp. NPDC050495]|uniref:hypothetical protein n=1 Tax=Micromonospora sp. NPDC050495 TaxID=3154936 RepID=UPI0033E13601